MAYRNYSTAVSHIVDTTGQGDFTTIATALTAASSGQTIFIRPGTYTENLTLKAGVNLTAFPSDDSLNNTGNVIISGTCTFTGSGSVTISGVQLQTNSAALLAVTGSSASVVNLIDCRLNCTNNSGITFSAANTNAKITMENCTGDLGTTGINLFAHSSTGALGFNWCSFGNTGGSTTASTASAGSLSCSWSSFNSPITTSSTNACAFGYCSLDTSGQNVTALTVGGSGSNTLYFSRVASGSATPISVGATLTTNGMALNSSNSAATAGAGTIVYTTIQQENTVGTLSTTTLTGKGQVGINSSTAPTAGYIGERISTAVASGSAVTITSGTGPSSIMNIVLTPGTWDISLIMNFTGGTTGTQISCMIGTTNNSTSGLAAGDNGASFPFLTQANNDLTLVVPAYRVNPSTSTTYYGIAYGSISVGSPKAYGRLSAVRVA